MTTPALQAKFPRGTLVQTTDEFARRFPNRMHPERAVVVGYSRQDECIRVVRIGFSEPNSNDVAFWEPVDATPEQREYAAAVAKFYEPAPRGMIHRGTPPKPRSFTWRGTTRPW